MHFTKFAAAAALSAMAGTALAGDMKFANFMPPTHPYVAGAFQPFADSVAERSGGALTVTLYSGGELGPGPVEQYSRVVDGVAEFAVSLPGYTASSFPLTLIAELPGVLEEATGTEKLWEHIDLLQPEYRRVKLVSLWSSAENVLYMRDTVVDAPDDLVGKKIRVPSRNTGKLVEAWGATPVSMPVNEIYSALQTGVIDGAMIDATATRAFKLGEVAISMTLGMETTNSPFFILMNRDAWEGLSDAEKAAVEAAGREASLLGNKVQLSVAADGIEAFRDMKGKQVVELTKAQAAAFDEIALEVTAEVVAETGGEARAFLDALAH